MSRLTNSWTMMKASYRVLKMDPELAGTRDRSRLVPGMLEADFVQRTGGRAYLKTLLFLLGWCFFGIGAVGVVVPGLPTTPFMLLALWAFSRSSKRFHNWLYSHPFFGPPLQNWERHRAISLPVKLLALVAMAGALAYMVFRAAVPVWILALTALIMVYGARFILTKPSRPGTGRGKVE